MRSQTLALSAVLVTLIAGVLVGPVGAQTTVFSDGAFVNADWSVFTEGVNLGGTGSGTQVASGGSPGSYRQATNTTNSALGFGFSNSVFTFHALAGAVFTPSSSGPILSIDYSEASLRVSGGVQACGLALKQGGVVYYGPGFLNPAAFGVWATTAQPGLTAASFDALAPGVQNPDFSAAGGPIQLGFSRANSTSVGGDGSTTVGGIDNWGVTVHYEAPTPAEATTWGSVKARYAAANSR